jgi:hypothetical protein
MSLRDESKPASLATEYLEISDLRGHFGVKDRREIIRVFGDKFCGYYRPSPELLKKVQFYLQSVM